MQIEAEIQFSVFLLANSKWNVIKHFSDNSDAVKMCSQNPSSKLAVFRTQDGAKLNLSATHVNL